MAELLQVDPKELAACLVQEATVTRGRYSITVAPSRGHSHVLRLKAWEWPGDETSITGTLYKCCRYIMSSVAIYFFAVIR